MKVVIEHSASIYSLAFHPSGDCIATGTWNILAKQGDFKGKVRVIRTETWQTDCEVEHEGGVRDIAFHPQGDFIATSSYDHGKTFFFRTANLDLEIVHGAGKYRRPFAFNPAVDLMAIGDEKLLFLALQGGFKAADAQKRSAAPSEPTTETASKRPRKHC